MKTSFLYLFGCFFLLISCKKEVKQQVEEASQKSVIKYAQGFDIVKTNNLTKLVIKSPYPNAEEVFEYEIQDKKSEARENSIQVPVKRIVATSTTHIPMIELLGKEKSIIGFPHTKYISSEKTRALVEAGNITEIGKEASMNTEILLDLKPELVVGFSMSKTNKTLTIIEENGIPVVLNGDWLEETPLGRAEWIKFFGVLFNKEKEADSIFNHIEKEYLQAKQIAKKATTKPSILSGAIMSKDIWNLPAGDSFVAQYLQDANTNYLWKETTGKGSLSISFESVLDKAQNADFWIAPGYFSTKEQLLNSNKQYANFNAFKNNNLFTPNLKKGATGGVIYFELAPTRPDLVLKDIIKITHPKLLQNYEFTFFERMK
ncbi:MULTISPECIES: ABC transporter substrate-binding protein [Tenacibaculum]|uniref:ABC transporter substrate-binding protein n=1 Tax=Tenacibaculum TaxID=104267 RepID=UPI001F0A3769|nr:MULTISPECIES: ABC transporter substrate-binding protein [Tenacibaculum]MCH3882278.1 ABC transporter substrate-binding protein [Tenacibaculum aquimarinum]MDO6599910.1 ABC transporter substrate-binding protein [Tenacibaculum sp. 1_MG-2023]